MKYTKGSIGRVFVLKFDDNDVLIDKLASFAKKENIKAATMVFIGALRAGDLVAGPKQPVIPPDPNKITFFGGWEVMGIGTIFCNKSTPVIHLHGAMGKKRSTLIGCVRGKSKVFLVIEAIVFELNRVRAGKDIDPETGINLLKIFN